METEGVMQAGKKIKVMILDSALEPVFLDHASQDVFDYYFFIYDWRFHRDSTEILLALKDKRIEGMMLIYKRRMVDLRGSAEAVKALHGTSQPRKGEYSDPKGTRIPHSLKI